MFTRHLTTHLAPIFTCRIVPYSTTPSLRVARPNPPRFELHDKSGFSPRFTKDYSPRSPLAWDKIVTRIATVAICLAAISDFTYFHTFLNRDGMALKSQDIDITNETTRLKEEIRELQIVTDANRQKLFEEQNGTPLLISYDPQEREIAMERLLSNIGVDYKSLVGEVMMGNPNFQPRSDLIENSHQITSGSVDSDQISNNVIDKQPSNEIKQI